MHKIQLSLVSVVVLLSGLWLMADSLLPQPLTYFAFRQAFVQYSGVLAMGMMTMGMVLAVRPRWLERYLDGLDKMYRLHKWLGIGALLLALAHWWFAKGTKWMVGWGWLVRPQRRAHQSVVADNSVEAWLTAQRHLAETIGEWAFYLLLVVLVLALLKRIPYQWFAKIHRVAPLLYLAFVFHSVVLMKAAYWSQPVGWVMAMMLFGGSLCALWSLAGRVGAANVVDAHVQQTHKLPTMQVLQTTLVLDEGWPGHKAGQFAYVTFDKHEGAHPFTIASAWDQNTCQMRFVTKALGDYTAQLAQWLHPGTPVQVEGPYGCFDFEDDRKVQIWIGAGIGITPFLARMEQLAVAGEDRQVVLFHPVTKIADQARRQLEAAAAAAQVQLHIVDSTQDGVLSGEGIRSKVPNWAQASIWFCGPAQFGRQLRRDFVRRRLRARHFHQELFDMR